MKHHFCARLLLLTVVLLVRIFNALCSPKRQRSKRSNLALGWSCRGPKRKSDVCTFLPVCVRLQTSLIHNSQPATTKHKIRDGPSFRAILPAFFCVSRCSPYVPCLSSHDVHNACGHFWMCNTPTASSRIPHRPALVRFQRFGW